MILQEVFGPHDAGLERALGWLAETQLCAVHAADKARNPDGDPAGSWCETEFTGTGFPKVFYLRYHLYRLYFPLMAIGRFLQARTIQSGAIQNGAADSKAKTSSVAGFVNAS